MTNCTVFDGQAMVTASVGPSSSSAAKTALGASEGRLRLEAGEASKSTVTGRFPAALEAAASASGCLGAGHLGSRPGNGLSTQLPQALREGHVLGIRALAERQAPRAVSSSSCPRRPIMRRLLEDSFIFLASAAFLASVTGQEIARSVGMQNKYIQEKKKAQYTYSRQG